MGDTRAKEKKKYKIGRGKRQALWGKGENGKKKKSGREIGKLTRGGEYSRRKKNPTENIVFFHTPQQKHLKDFFR